MEKELKIGETATINGRTVICVEDESNEITSCYACVLLGSIHCELAQCSSHHRADKKNTHFEKL